MKNEPNRPKDSSEGDQAEAGSNIAKGKDRSDCEDTIRGTDHPANQTVFVVKAEENSRKSKEKNFVDSGNN
jgi:hypothetical protein